MINSQKNAGLTRGALTRQRIVDAALGCFAQKGVEIATLKDIAALVGISEPAVYRHFPSKAELIWTIFVDGYCGLAEEIDRAQQAETSLRRKIDRIIEVYCHLYDTNEPLFRFLFLTQHGQLDRLTPDMPSPVEIVSRVIGQGMANGEIPRQDAELLTALLFGLVTQPAVFQIYGRLKKPMTDYRLVLSSAAWAVLSVQVPGT